MYFESGIFFAATEGPRFGYYFPPYMLFSTLRGFACSIYCHSLVFIIKFDLMHPHEFFCWKKFILSLVLGGSSRKVETRNPKDLDVESEGNKS